MRRLSIAICAAAFACSGSEDPTDSGVNNTADSGVARDTGVAPDSGVNPVCNPTFGMPESCDGTITGTWSYQNACTGDDLLDPVRQACPAIQVSNQVTTTSGMVTFNADLTFTRHVDTDVSGDVVVPALCAQIAGGCAGVETAVERNAGTTATCSGAADCNCQINVRVTTDDNGTYSTANGVLTARVNAMDYAYWYCVDAGALRYRGQQGIGNNDDVFTFTLTQ